VFSRVARLRELTSRLEEKLPSRRALEAGEEQSAKLAARHDSLRSRFKAVAASEQAGNEIAGLAAAARRIAESAQDLVADTVQRLGDFAEIRNQLEEERAWWGAVQARGLESPEGRAVEPTLRDAQERLASALARVTDTEAPFLRFQGEATRLRGDAETLAQEIEVRQRAARGGLLKRTQPPIFAREFYAAFDRSLLREAATRLFSLPLPDAPFLVEQGWFLLPQLLMAWGIARAVRRQRRKGASAGRWQFLTERPAATGLFAAFALPGLLYVDAPSSWRFAQFTVTALGAARLVGALMGPRRDRARLIYLVTGVLLVTDFLMKAAVPPVLFRLYVTAAALAGVWLFWSRSRRVARAGASLGRVWLLRAGGLLMAVTMLAEVAGYAALGAQLFNGSLRTAAVVLMGWLAAASARGGIEFLVSLPLAQRSPVLRHHAAPVVRRAGLVSDGCLAILALAGTLYVWGAYDAISEALRGILDLGFTVGQNRLTLGVLLGALAALYVSLWASWLLQTFLEEEVYRRRNLELGVRISINRLIQYAFVLLGALIALSVLGIGLEKFAIIGGALGVGIGFGLQTIVNNFISGLILLFERPIKVGDVIQIRDEWAVVRRLGLRATIVQTFGRADLIVPNSELVSTIVTNWTLEDRLMRVIVKVAVALGSNVPLVTSILEGVGRDVPQVVKDPTPQVVFMAFGERSLDFELRVWTEIDDFLAARTGVQQEIERRLREAGVEIAVPRQDLYLRDVAKGAVAALSGRDRTTTGPLPESGSAGFGEPAGRADDSRAPGDDVSGGR